MKIFTAMVLVVLTYSTGMASELCLMDKNAANSSESCVRWYFACELGDLRLGPAVPPFDDIPYSKRQELVIELTFQEAEKNCTNFDYAGALEAMNAKKTLINRN